MKCPHCNKSELVENNTGLFDVFDCMDCGLEFDEYHIDLMNENKRLREALEQIIKTTDYKLPRYSDVYDDRNMAVEQLLNIEETAKQILEATK